MDDVNSVLSEAFFVKHKLMASASSQRDHGVRQRMFDQKYLAGLNDGGKDFGYIADYIEENLNPAKR